MAEIVVSRATRADAAELAPRLRPEAYEEIAGFTVLCPEAFIVHAVTRSTLAWTARIDGAVEAMWGVVPVSIASGVGAPWLLAAEGAERHRRAFVCSGRKFIEEIRGIYPTLVAAVDARHSRAVRWARWLGFRDAGERRFETSPIPYRHMVMEA